MMDRMALCAMIYNFDFEPIDEENELHPGSALLSELNGFHMKINRRDPNVKGP